MREKSGYLEPPKCISQLFGASKKRMTVISMQKNRFTAIWSTKKNYHSYLNVDKTGLQLFRARKTLSQQFGENKKWIPAIWRPNNVVHNSFKEEKKDDSYFEPEILFCSYFKRVKRVSLLFGAFKMYFTTFLRKQK